MLHKPARWNLGSHFLDTSTAALAPARTGSWTFSVVIPIEITPDQNTQGAPSPCSETRDSGPSSSEARAASLFWEISASPDWVHILGRSIQPASILTVSPHQR